MKAFPAHFSYGLPVALAFFGVIGVGAMWLATSSLWILLAAVVVMLVGINCFRPVYEFREDRLSYRQGPHVYWSLRLEIIDRVVPARGQTSQMMDKRDGLVIGHQGNARFVAPLDREGMMDALAERSPHLRRYAGELRGGLEPPSSTLRMPAR